MLEEPPLNPPKNGLPKERVEGTENPELAYLLNLQKILYLQTILSLPKITTSRGRGRAIRAPGGTYPLPPGGESWGCSQCNEDIPPKSLTKVRGFSMSGI